MSVWADGVESMMRLRMKPRPCSWMARLSLRARRAGLSSASRRAASLRFACWRRGEGGARRTVEEVVVARDRAGQTHDRVVSSS